ncbi:hypothetical protein A9B99_04365 [Mangrovibacter phragmitis]|uniref:Uncharacterized protein n=1 Tax=Mangrovibacter phragmitis TaxID=1691903 RepID=A0A1B7L9D8_9ENTR|nr:hypothetical protein A9B99_04365 [Mangrovibacter phragmitis]
MIISGTERTTCRNQGAALSDEAEVGAKKMTTDAVSIQLTGGHTVTALALLPALNRLSTMLSAVIAAPIWSLSLSFTDHQCLCIFGHTVVFFEKVM